MTRRAAGTVGSHATKVAAEVSAEANHETRLREPEVTPARPPQPEAAGEESSVAALTDTNPKGPNHLDHRTIVVGVDGSECGRAALAWAADEARRRGAELVVLAAWVPQGPMSGPMLAPGADL